MKRMICLAAAWLIPAAALAQTGDDRAPGLLFSVFETSGGLLGIPDMPAGQAPNSIRAVTKLDFDIERNDFGAKEDFVSQLNGYLTVSKPGMVAFQITSDDGSRLWIDEQVVIDHDGPHAAEPKQGSVELGAGEHTILIRHFQGSGGGALKLEWKPSGAPAFSAIPADALSHSAKADMTSAPGKKRVIAPLRRGRPGDGSPVKELSPAYTHAPAPERPRTLLIGMNGTAWPEVTALSRPLGGVPGAFLFLPNGDGLGLGHVARQSTDKNSGGIIVANGTRALWRGELDRCDDLVQGALFRFAEAMPDKLERLALDVDGTIYAWNTEGVFKVDSMPPFMKFVPSGKTPFEMRGLHMMNNGVEIEFTQPLLADIGWEPDSYLVEQWAFDIDKRQAPTRDGVATPVKSATVSSDRRKVFLEIAGLKPNHVVYLRLLPPCVSESGEQPFSTEAWYTLRALPKDRAGQVGNRPALPPMNQLSDAEKKEGWRLLFDGQTTKGWHNFKKTGAVAGWDVIDGALVRTGQGGDIVTDDKFDNFELKLEWRICPAGNSGVMFRVSEDENWPWRTGPEMQVLDNAEHPDGRNPKTSAGSNYALIAPPRDVTKPLGLFNEARIVCRGPHVEYWLNGLKTAEYEINSPEWKALVEASKFKEMPRYGQNTTGVIALQDHGDKVWFRNVKVRALPVNKPAPAK